MQKLEKKKNKRIILMFAFSMLAFSSCFTFAAGKKTDTDLNTFKLISDLRLENTRDLLKKDIQNLAIRIDAQEKRVDSQNSHIDQSLSLLSIVLGVLGVVFAVGSFVGYFSVRSRALKQAELSAEEWFNKNAGKVQGDIEALREKLKGLDAAADTNFISHKEKMKEKETLADKAVVDLQRFLSSPPDKKSEKDADEDVSGAQPLSETVSEALAQVAMATKDKPESKFDFNDYNFRAFDSFRRGDKESAIQFWRAAAYHHTATPSASYQALLNIARTLAQLSRHDEAISIFDDILDRNSQHSSKNSKLIEIRALNGKALSLAQKRDFDQSLEVYNLVMDKISEAGGNVPEELIIDSLGNRAVALEMIGEYEEALKVHDEILKEYGDKKTGDSESVMLNVTVCALRALARLRRYEEFDARFEKMVAKLEGKSSAISNRYISLALNSKGFSLLCLAKEQWADEEQRRIVLTQACELLKKGVELNPVHANILGNLAYCKYLLGFPSVEFKSQLASAISLGGKDLYRDTLEDLAIYPIPDVDDEFRKILDDVMNIHLLGKS